MFGLCRITPRDVLVQALGQLAQRGDASLLSYALDLYPHLTVVGAHDLKSRRMGGFGYQDGIRLLDAVEGHRRRLCRRRVAVVEGGV